MYLALAQYPLALGAWLLGLLIWRVLEAIVDFRTLRRLRTSLQRQDRGSRTALLCLVVGGMLLGAVLALRVPATAITLDPPFFGWLGVALLYAGLALRCAAIAALGSFFTTAVAVTPEQPVIDAGPYRRIRHPSYTGLLLILLGFGLGLLNWLSLLVIMGCALAGCVYRIRVEEGALKEQLGQPYREYMRRTKRLIPYVL